MRLQDATSNAFRRWDETGFSHSKKSLKKRYGVGSDKSWKNFVNAMKLYKRYRSEGQTEDEAVTAIRDVYNVVLKQRRDFTPTQNLKGARTGPHPRDMKQKTGRKRKSSTGTFKAMKKAMLRHPKATDADIAAILNQRSSQATDENLSQPHSQDLQRKVTIKGTKKLDHRDVQKLRTSGAKHQSSNKSGNRRGMGRRNWTVQVGRKQADEWNPIDGNAFLEARSEYDPTEIAHFDTTHFSSRVVDKGKVKGPQGSSRIHRSHERVATGASCYLLSWAGNEDYDPGMYDSFEPNFRKCAEIKNVKRGCDEWPCPHGPAIGEDRQCGGGGTRWQHVEHLTLGLEMFLTDTGIAERKGLASEKPVGSASLPRRCLQLDKSTCLIYLQKKNELGYNGVPTKRLQAVLDDLETRFLVKLGVLIQPTHYFIWNANDALLFSLIKHYARKEAAKPYNFPKNIGDLRQLWNSACDEISLNCIQASIQRAHSVDENHETNMGNPPFGPRLQEWNSNSNTPSNSRFYDPFHVNVTDDENSDSD